MIAAFLACAGTETPSDSGPPPAELTLPDITGVDLEAAFATGLEVAIDTRMEVPWDAHVATLATASGGCPDSYLGVANEDLEVESDADGYSWSDHCTAGDGVEWSGSLWWNAELSTEGDPESAEGATTSASRSLVGDGAVADGPDVRFAFTGDASDGLTLITAPGYESWTWSTLITGSIEGSTAFEGSVTPGGYRVDSYLYVLGGDVERFEARAELFFYDDLIGDRFDSVALDLVMVSPEYAGPDACATEPTGFLSLRDQDAYWYDLVFMPSDQEVTDIDADACDGCGTLYLRGVPSVEVCPDLDFLWDGRLDTPALENFVLSLHGLP